MNQYYRISLDPLPEFIGAGICHGRPGYIHTRRAKLTQPELFVVEKGVLFIQGDDCRVKAEPGMTVFHPAGILQRGYDRSPDGVKFVWVHFAADTPATVSGDAGHLGGVSVTIPSSGQCLHFDEILRYAYLLAETRPGISIEKSLLVSLLLCRISSGRRRSSLPAQQSKSARLADDIRYVIAKYLSAPVSTADIAREMGLNPDYCNRILKKETGLTISELILQAKMERASVYLKSHSVKETAFFCGYNDPKYFARQFRRWSRVTPSQYTASMGETSRNF